MKREPKPAEPGAQGYVPVALVAYVLVVSVLAVGAGHFVGDALGGRNETAGRVFQAVCVAALSVAGGWGLAPMTTRLRRRLRRHPSR